MTLLQLHRSLEQDNQTLVDYLKENDILIYNGGYFSDCGFFTKGKEYKIKLISETRLKVTCNMSFMPIDIFPHGLNSFTLKEEVL